MVLQDRVFPCQALVIVVVVMVLQWLVFCVLAQVVLKSIVAYVFLHSAGVEEGLNGLAAHVLSFCDTFCPMLR